MTHPKLHLPRMPVDPDAKRSKRIPQVMLRYFGGTPFPPDTRGFFHYHHPPRLPFLASGVRFRITPDTDPSPANFDAGKDLLLPLGVPWQISFPSIAVCTLMLGRLREYLVRCDAITQSQLDTYRRMFGCYLPVPYHLLYTLDQPFPISFSAYSIGLYVVGPGEKIFRFRLPFSYERTNARPESLPYRGSALVQLKPSTLPEHTGRNVLVMQILKIVQPVTCIVPEYDGDIPWPEEGSLLYHRGVPRRGIRSRVWICDLDEESPTSVGLRMLRDVSPSRM